MTPRRRAILIVSLAVLLLLLIGLFVWWLLSRRAPAPQAPAAAPSEEQSPAKEPTPQPILDALHPASAAAPAAGRTAATQMAELFAERYGSYSNQGGYRNLSDLLPVMTPSYRAATEAYLASASSSDGEAYEGVTSVKISTQVRSYDEKTGAAVIAVTLQQQKTVGTGGPTASYRSLKVSLKKIGEDWRVDAASWED